MKRCPKCSQMFNESFDFCLDDGTWSTNQTRVEKFGRFQGSGEIPRQFISRPPMITPVPTQSSSKWLYLIVGLFAAAVIFGGIVVMYEPYRRDNTKENKYETVRTENSASNVSTPMPINKTNSPNSDSPALVPASVPARPQVSTVRMRFVKGAVTSSVTGSLFAGGIKNYVLACRAGQQLTATISTSDGCIVFADASTVFRSVTKRGDNLITVKNACNGNGGYRLDITII